MSNKVAKRFRIRKDFVLNGQNVFEGEYLEERDVGREFEGKIQGLIRRGFIEVLYSEPKPEPECAKVDCVQQQLENSSDFEVSAGREDREIKNIEVSLKDQSLVDQANLVRESQAEHVKAKRSKTRKG